jgi:hypothetical protein
MAMGRSEGVQGDLMATRAEMPRSPGHAFYDRLQELLRGAGFDAFVEGCAGATTRRGWARRRCRRGGTACT